MNDLNEVNKLVKKIDYHALPNLASTLQKLESGKHPEHCRCGYCDPDNEMSIATMQKRAEFNPVESDQQERIVLKPNSSIEEIKNIISRQEERYNKEIAAGEILEHPDFLNADDMKRIINCWADTMGFNKIEEEEKALPRLEGVLIFYIDVGYLAPDKADAYLEEVKDKYAAIKKRMPETWETTYIPTKAQSRVEVIRF